MQTRHVPARHDPLAWLGDLPPTLTRAAAARVAGCSERHLDRAIARGDIITIMHGTRRRVVLRDSLRGWLAVGLAAGGHEAGQRA